MTDPQLDVHRPQVMGESLAALASRVLVGGVQRLAGGVDGGDLTARTLIGRLLAQKSADAG